MAFEDQRKKLLDCWRSEDTEGMRSVISEVVDIALAEPQHSEDSYKLLCYWTENYDVGMLLTSVYDDKERSLHDQRQTQEDQLAALAEALIERRHWIEKLILVADIQHLQADSRYHAHQQVERKRHDVHRMQTEIAQLEDELSRRVVELRKEL